MKEVRHEPERKRFVLDVDGDEAVVEYREAGERTLDYRHTFVPEAQRQRGIGERLVLGALDHARENGLRVIPTCPFVRRVLDEHPEYEDLAQR